MKKRIILSLIFSLLLGGCSNLGSIRTVNGNKVQNIEDPNEFSSIAYVNYFDVSTLKNEEDKKAELAFRKPDYSEVPKNGYVAAHVSTHTLESANTSWWRVVVRDNTGKVISSKKGSDKVAKPYTANGITTWNNSIVVLLPEIELPFDVYVISELTNKRWGYKVLGK